MEHEEYEEHGGEDDGDYQGEEDKTGNEAIVTVTSLLPKTGFTWTVMRLALKLVGVYSEVWIIAQANEAVARLPDNIATVTTFKAARVPIKSSNGQTYEQQFRSEFYYAQRGDRRRKDRRNHHTMAAFLDVDGRPPAVGNVLGFFDYGGTPLALVRIFAPVDARLDAPDGATTEVVLGNGVESDAVEMTVVDFADRLLASAGTGKLDGAREDLIRMAAKVGDYNALPFTTLYDRKQATLAIRHVGDLASHVYTIPVTMRANSPLEAADLFHAIEIDT